MKSLLSVVLFIAALNAATIQQAHQFYQKQEYFEALQMMKQLCHSGDSIACVGAGDIYKQGKGIAKNTQNATKYYKKACVLNNPFGCYNLGQNIENTQPKEAKKLYEKACDYAVSQACFDLAVISSQKNNLNQKQDIAQSVQFLQKGCRSAHPQSCYYLAQLYLDGQGVAKDEFEAARLFEKACAYDAGGACYNYGYMIFMGQGAVQDTQKAVTVWQKGCTLENAMSCLNLGLLYESGDRIKKDEEKALQFYAKACEAKSSEGCKMYSELKRRID